MNACTTTRRASSVIARPATAMASLAILAASSALAAGDIEPGDGPEDAGLIPALPFAASGDTSAFTDQFDVVCPLTGSTAPDAWFRYEPAEDTLLMIELCESSYDTKAYVLDAAFGVVGCNDDGCSDSDGNPYRSRLQVIALAGQPLYIVVDGFGAEAGPFELTVEGIPAPEFCVPPCPEGAIVEVEPCDPGSPDTVNGGCNFGPPTLLSPVVCGSVFCGSVWAQGGTRDLDWFEHSADAMNQVTMTVSANFNALLIHLGVNHACDRLGVVDATVTDLCGTASVRTETDVLAGDTSWWIVTTDGFDGVPCSPSAEYVASFTCAPAPPEPCPPLGDVSGDGFVDFDDLLVVLANFGECP